MKLKLLFLALSVLVLSSCNSLKTAVNNSPVKKQPAKVIPNNNLINKSTGDITGQREIKDHLIQTVLENRVSHAQLFLGPEGSGIRY